MDATNHLIEQRMLMLTNLHFGPLLGMTAPTVSDVEMGVDNRPEISESGMRWARFVRDQWANRN